MNPHDDLAARWLPDPAAVRHATALLAAAFDAEYAVIPMYQPGKHYGIWITGQQVETVLGAVFLAGESPLLDYHRARNLATLIAQYQLEGEHGAGTTAYAVVHRDGHVAVFEDMEYPQH